MIGLESQGHQCMQQTRLLKKYTEQSQLNVLKEQNRHQTVDNKSFKMQIILVKQKHSQIFGDKMIRRST